MIAAGSAKIGAVYFELVARMSGVSKGYGARFT